jgi:hypothetical protein
MVGVQGQMTINMNMTNKRRRTGDDARRQVAARRGLMVEGKSKRRSPTLPVRMGPVVQTAATAAPPATPTC